MSFPQYERYKDSGVEWLGEVPEHWSVRRLRHAARIENGRDHKEIEVEEGGYPVFGSGGAFARASSFLSEKPSVLLGRKGTIDRPLYVDEPFWTVDTSFYTVVSEDMDAKFLYYQCLGIPFSFYSNGTALPSMTQTTLYEVPSLRPTIVEQQRIVLFVDSETAKIDGLIEEQRRLIELLKEKRQAVISHAVTKGLNPKVARKKSGVEWVGDVPEHWTTAPLRRLILEQLVNGIFKKRDEFGEGTLLVNVFDIYQGDFKIKFRQLDRVKCDDWEIDAYRVLPGDLFFVRSSLKQEGIAAVALAEPWHENAVFECHLIRARPNPTLLHARFGSYLLNSVIYRSKTLSIAKITTMTTLDQEAVLSIVLPVPPVREQRAIAEYLDRKAAGFEELIDSATSAVGLLWERRSALISAAVTGKIDVRNYVPKEAE